MTESDKLSLIHDYLETVTEESRVAAVEAHLSDDARVTINGDELTRTEYITQISESDRTFVPNQHDIHRTIIQDEMVVLLVESHVTQVGTAYGVKPTDESWTQCYAVFNRIVDGEIVELDVVTDRATRLQQLGLLSDDPTKEQLKNQYYQVLNRVLRHDLRNRLNVIRLYADALAEDTVTDTTVAGMKIRERVDELLQTTDKARGLEKLAIDTAVEPTTCQLDTLVDSLAGKYEENTDATLTTEFSTREPPELTTDKKLLWNAINELLENAVIYNESIEPTVTVRVHDSERPRYTYEIQIEDNGPQIPEAVITPILENEETELLHGSGIGLWIASWCLTRLDGEMVFEYPDTGGTRVRLLLPELD